MSRFEENAKELEEYVYHTIAIAFNLGAASGGQRKGIQFNKNADRDLYGTKVDYDFIKQCKEGVGSKLKTLVRMNKIYDVRGKRKPPLKVVSDHSKLKEPVVMTDQLYNFIMDKNVNLGLANLYLFTNLTNLEEISRHNGSKLTDVRTIMDNPGVVETVRGSGVDLPDDFSFSEEDFDLRKTLEPLLKKRLIRRYDINRLLAIIEHVNDVNKEGRFKTLPEMDKYFGKNTDSVLRVCGKEIGSKLDVKGLLPIAEKVEELSREKNKIQKHSKYNTEEEKKVLLDKLKQVSDELKDETEKLRTEMKNSIGWSPTNPARLIINISNKNKSLYDLLDDTPVTEGKAKPFVKKEDSQDGHYGYTNSSRMKLLSHLSVQHEFVNSEYPNLIEDVSESFEEELDKIDSVLSRLMDTYKKVSSSRKSLL